MMPSTAPRMTRIVGGRKAYLRPTDREGAVSVHRPPAAIIREDATAGLVLVDVVITPSAARTEVRGTDPWRHGIQIRVAAKPTEGAANAELLRFLSQRLDVPPSSVRLVAGHRSRRKTVGIRGRSREDVEERLGLRGR